MVCVNVSVVPMEDRRRVLYSGAGVIEGCELPDMDAETRMFFKLNYSCSP